jgi:hypothetical protein
VLPNSSSLTKLLVDAHIEELRRSAARSRTVRRAREDLLSPNRRLELPTTLPPAQPTNAPLGRRRRLVRIRNTVARMGDVSGCAS